MTSHKLTRRQFLIRAGVAVGLGALPGWLGYRLWQAAAGELPQAGSPYTNISLDIPAQLKGDNLPLLIAVNDRAQNSFGVYLTEILRAEGLNCFNLVALSALNSTILERFDLVILAEGPMDTAQVEMLESYVAKGGRLVAMRPDTRLASLFGVEPAAGQTTEGYLQVAAEHPVGQGITTQTLQFHGEADHYRLAGAEVVAWLAGETKRRAEFPAISIHRYEHGQAVLWAFDLARSIAYTRQGNPAWANQERDGGDGIRAVDMFKDWINLERLTIPQADEQQRLLINLLTALSQEKRPLPRLWYFPNQATGMLIATGDAHKTSVAGIERTLTFAEQYGGRMSIYYSPQLIQYDLERAIRQLRYLAADYAPAVNYYIPEQFAAPTPTQVARWRSRGHEFTLHPYVEEGLQAGWQKYWKEFTGRGYGVVSPTVRTHRILWTGWIETARIQASYGIRLNLDYYHWGPLFRSNGGQWLFGYVTGSGLPMKFVDEQGRILNIYQQLTELADDHMVKFGWEWDGPAKINPDECVEIARVLFRRGSEGAYTAFVGQFHADPFGVEGEVIARAKVFMGGILEAATSWGFPIWSAQEWLRFTEVRHDANFEAIEWRAASKRLSFKLAAQEAAGQTLTVMIPLRHGDTTLAGVEVDGQTVRHDNHAVGGVNYGWVSVSAGDHQVLASYV